MELQELRDRTLAIFEINTVSDLGEKLLECVKNNNISIYQQFVELVGDLSVDWLQKIYQYYEADREEKKQDYTPKSLALLCAKLCGDDDCVDMCSGSGALTIQKWNINKDIHFDLYEFDENVLPYLIFNMIIRNIDCTIYHSDVLQDEIFQKIQISKGDNFGVAKWA